MDGERGERPGPLHHPALMLCIFPEAGRERQYIREEAVKNDLSLSMTTLTLLATLTIPLHVSAQQHHYQVIDLGTFGGPSSYLAGSNAGNDAVTLVGFTGTLTAQDFVFA